MKEAMVYAEDSNAFGGVQDEEKIGVDFEEKQ